MHYNTELCKGCKLYSSCIMYWGESCRMNGGTKIPRVVKNAYYQPTTPEKEEQARQQAVRDQLRADGNEAQRRSYWLPRLAKVVGR